MIRELALSAFLLASASANADDLADRLRHARGLRCTYTAESVTAFGPEGRKITTDHDVYSVTFDSIDVERGTARVTDRNIAADVTVKWQPNEFGAALWFVETAPAGNLLVTAVFARQTPGSDEFIALESRQSSVLFVSGSMASGTCKVVR